MWDSKGCGVQRLQGKTLGPKIRTSEDPTIKGSSDVLSVLVVHYSLGFIAYKAESGGVFFRCGTPKDAV